MNKFVRTKSPIQDVNFPTSFLRRCMQDGL